MRASILLVAFAVSACEFSPYSPGKLGLSEIEGRYIAPACPDIVISNGQIHAAGRSASFRHISIKEKELLLVPGGAHARLPGGCQVTFGQKDIFVPIGRNAAGRMEISLMVQNELLEVRFTKIEGRRD